MWGAGLVLPAPHNPTKDQPQDRQEGTVVTTKKTSDTPTTTSADAAEAGFDFDAWLGTGSKPAREVTLYADNALQADIERLERDRAVLVEQHKTTSGAGSWGAPDDAVPGVDRVDADLAAARKRLEASGVVFRVQALDADVDDEIRRAHPFPKDADDDTRSDIMQQRLLSQMAVQIIGPRKMTVADLQKMRKAIGEPEFTKLFQACQATISDVSASSPFWRANSGSSRN